MKLETVDGGLPRNKLEAKTYYPFGTIFYMRDCPRIPNFKARPYVVISDQREVDDKNKFVCLEVTSNYLQKDSIPIVLDDAVGFVCTMETFIFYENEIPRRYYYGSVPEEVLDIIRYKFLKNIGLRTDESDKIIEDYCKNILSDLESGKIRLYRDRKNVNNGYDAIPKEELHKIFLGGKYYDPEKDSDIILKNRDEELVNAITNAMFGGEDEKFIPEIEIEEVIEDEEDIEEETNEEEGEQEEEKPVISERRNPDMKSLQARNKPKTQRFISTKSPSYRKDRKKLNKKTRDAARKLKKGRMKYSEFENLCISNGVRPDMLLTYAEIEMFKLRDEVKKNV